MRREQNGLLVRATDMAVGSWRLQLPDDKQRSFSTEAIVSQS
ncbi:hypothetical protein M153_8880002190 [Pseudoloma neurophilia]|uniref:Uncharacterized protein n=1 Tax=Pseudoloma neurophilia TaxID=146866 RepID=A0A0R0LVM0_9MICR|nr:hypothetical protein M153_8880002190 [Pseudoloma neurophilia]